MFKCSTRTIAYTFTKKESQGGDFSQYHTRLHRTHLQTNNCFVDSRATLCILARSDQIIILMNM